MSLLPLDGVSALVNTIINKVWPDKTAQQQAQVQLALQESLQEFELKQGQIEVNKVEAANASIFVSGARPFLMWICGASFAWQFVLEPFVSYIFAACGHPLINLPVLDNDALNTLLFGMLGLTGARTLEKVKGVASK